MDVRRAEDVDFEALAGIFYDAVHIGAAGHYSAEQRLAWAPKRPEAATFADRFAGQIVLVAFDPLPVGFFCLRRDGYLDMCYVAPDRIGQGIARVLMAEVEDSARALGLTQLHTHASEVAEPVFAHLGWDVIRSNTVEKKGVRLRNWVMVKELTS